MLTEIDLRLNKVLEPELAAKTRRLVEILPIVAG